MTKRLAFRSSLQPTNGAHRRRVPTTSRSWILLAWVILIWTVAAPGLRAGEAEDRADLMRRIDILMEELEEETLDAAHESQAGARNALKAGQLRITRLKTALRDLHRVKGQDAAANERARGWPRQLRDFEQAHSRLVRLKGSQFAFDDLAGSCQRREKKLRQELEQFFDPVKITRLARQHGRPVKATLQRSGQVIRQLRQDQAAVRRFQGRGAWRDHQNALRHTADLAVDYADRTYEAAEDACQELVLQEKSRLVRQALEGVEEVEDERLRLMTETDGHLADVAEILEGGFAQDADARRLKQVKQVIKARLAPRLKRLRLFADRDETTKERVTAWPRALGRLGVAMKGLDVMKRNQFHLDDLAAECQEAEGKLHFEILSYLGRPKKPEGFIELPQRGIELGKHFGGKVSEGEDLLRSLGREASGVESFEGAEGWDEVEEVVHHQADMIYVHVEDKLGEAKSACRNLLRGRFHPRIVKASKELQAFSDRGLNLFNVEVGKWITASRKIFALNCEAMEALWDDYCAMDGEPNEEEERERMMAADRAWLAAEIDEKIEDMLDRFKKLEPQHDYLTDPSQPAKIQSGATRIFTRAKGRKAKLEGILKKAIELEGNQDPIHQFATRYGIQRHKEMTSRYRCDVADKTYRKGRPDCVVAKSCMVLEFKPKNPDQVAKGFEQLLRDPGYVDQIEDYYSDFLPVGGTPRRVPSSSKGGEQIMLDLQDAGCIKGDRVHFGHDVKTYKVCTMPFTCNSNP